MAAPRFTGCATELFAAAPVAATPNDVKVKWAVPKEKTWRKFTDFYIFAGRVRLLRKICLGVNPQVGCAGITAGYDHYDGKESLDPSRFLRHQSIIFALKDEDGSNSPPQRDLIQLPQLLDQTGEEETLDLAEWSHALEEFEGVCGLNHPNIHGQEPRPPQMPPIEWKELPPISHSDADAQTRLICLN